MNEKITVTLTHYRRPELLDRTVDSFLKTNQYPIDEFLIIDDSGDPRYIHSIADKYKDVATIIINEKNLGQRQSLDILFNICKNEDIFHLEEDWLFDGSSTTYINDSLIILKNRLDVHQVHIRHQDDDPHPAVGEVNYIGNVGYSFLDPNFREVWNGFSFNPGLRRRSDIKKIFSEGLIKFEDERHASLHTRVFNYKAVRLENTACRHIGYGASTQTGRRGL